MVQMTVYYRGKKRKKETARETGTTEDTEIARKMRREGEKT